MDYVGGCQCGKIRYWASGPRDRASICHCRMCQKASGSPFMAFVRFPAAQVDWSSPPAIFASSNYVERGFCRHCGTPLTYRNITGPWVSLTINSLDDPESVRPETVFSPDTVVSWCSTLLELPANQEGATFPADFVSHQR